MVEMRSIIQRVNSIPRDLTVCTGDYIQAHEWEIDKIWPELMKLNAPMGVLSVLGNHDHWNGCTKRSILWLEKSGQNLRHKIKRFERDGQALWFVGAGDLWEDNVNIDDLMKPIPENDCRIVLAHNPDSADTIVKSNPDLMICGHTHGGQINVPFYGPPVLSVNNRNYSSGLKRSKRGFPVFISRGIGWAVYPVRFNCFPEIAVLRLTRG
jgi:predicted MPP superfamily phosphohydrolase